VRAIRLFEFRTRLFRPQARQIEPWRVRLSLMMWSLSSARIVRFVLAPALSLWVAGAGCMFACGSMVAAAASHSGMSEDQHAGQSVAIVDSGHACSSAKSHDCCAKSKTEDQTKASPTEVPYTALMASEQSSSREAMGCPLAVNGAAVVTKVSSKEIAAPAALSTSTYPNENFIEQKTSLSPRPRLPNRGYTYLRCCVFLI